MALPFTRSLRSLQTDSDHAATVVIGLVVLLLTAWGVWFFGARIALTEMGRIVQTSLDGMVWAEFPAESGARLRPEQPAQIRFHETNGQQSKPVSATVLSVDPRPDGPLRVTLYAALDAENIRAFTQGRSGDVAIEAERLSPAQLLMRVSGQTGDTPAAFTNALRKQ